MQAGSAPERGEHKSKSKNTETKTKENKKQKYINKNTQKKTSKRCLLSPKRWRTAATLRGSNHERSARRSPRRFARMFPSRSATRKLQKNVPKPVNFSLWTKKILIFAGGETAVHPNPTREVHHGNYCKDPPDCSVFQPAALKNIFVKVWHFADLPPSPKCLGEYLFNISQLIRLYRFS